MNSVRTFMEHIIDYAGLFPPASLSLKTAIHNYAMYQNGDDAWMLGKFIIPSTRLGELSPYVPLFTKPLPISSLGRKSENWSDCLKGLSDDLTQMAQFCDQHGNAVEINVFEMPLPPVQPNQGSLEIIAKETAQQGVQTFCEITLPRNADWESRMIETLDAIAHQNQPGKPALGVKWRMGGVTEDAFPTPDEAAAVLTGCRDRGIAMKFTAGLHHPIRMFRREVNTKMHGFLNVFAAGMLSHVYKLDKKGASEILADEEANHFTFDEKGLTWQELSVDDQQMKQFRETSFHSFGSCSFDEPREDLRMLKILEESR